MQSKTIRWELVVLLILATVLIVRLVTPSVYDIGTPGPLDQAATLEGSLPTDQATFRGGWRTSDMDEAAGPQSILIECRKAAMECVLTQTSVSYSDYFYQDIGYYKITEWTDGGAITAEQDGECGDSVLTADASSASARIVTLWDQTQAEECGLVPGEVSMEWILESVESSDFAKIREQFYDFCYDFDFCYDWF